MSTSIICAKRFRASGRDLVIIPALEKERLLALELASEPDLVSCKIMGKKWTQPNKQVPGGLCVAVPRQFYPTAIEQSSSIITPTIGIWMYCANTGLLLAELTRYL